MRNSNSTFRAVFGLVAAALAFPTQASAQQLALSSRTEPDSVTIAAGIRYRASALHRWISGNTYRDLWATPIRVPVLNLHTFAGGVRPTKVGGGMQTKSLRLMSTSGTEYVFRLSDKIVTSGPIILRDTPTDRIFQDQVSAMHPAAAQVSAVIVEASGVLHPTAAFMIIPDDSALGKYRAEFAGRLGMIEEYPNVPAHGIGFGGASKIIDSEELLQLLNTDSRQHVNARAFLTARLADFLINDTDRHPGNWKWARLDSGEKTQWEPIARDRDHAFVAYDGWFPSLVRKLSPSLVSMGDAPSDAGLTQSQGFDARLLESLEKPAWDSVAQELKNRITDAVIADAARAMPAEYQASASKLEAQLKKRRDVLLQAANQFYRLLAKRVEIHGTDAADRAVITRVSDQFVDVRIESQGQVFFARRFDARETSEILVRLQDGDDTALVVGEVSRSILVRIIGGNGTNTLVDSSSVAGTRNPTRLYNTGTVSGISYGADTLFERRPWDIVNGHLAPPGPDYGAAFEPLAGLSFHRRIGITPRIGVARYQYGFADRPYSSMIKLEAEYAMEFQGLRLGLTADKRLESSPLHFTAFARMSDFETVNFNGFGNATIDSGGSNSYFEVHQRQWLFHPAFAMAVGSRTDISLGPVIQHAVTDSARNRYLSVAKPYGFGTFNQAGVQLGVRYEWRSVRAGEEHTHHRVFAELNGFYYPKLMDVRSAFEVAAASMGASLTLPVPLQPILVARVGGKKLRGDFPFFEAATIGGEGTTRYMDTERFAGDASLYGTTELRVPLVHFKFLMPIRAGILGLAEAGRVYDNGHSPGGWYTRTGEGIWFGRGNASPVVTFSRTTELGHAGIHARLGLNF